MKKIKISLLALTTIVLFAVALTFTFNSTQAAFPGKKATTEQSATSSNTSIGTNQTTVSTATVTTTDATTTDANTALELSTGLLILIAIFWPTLAVALAYDFDFDNHLKEMLINLLLTFLCYIPGLIHAIIHIKRAKA